MHRFHPSLIECKRLFERMNGMKFKKINISRLFERDGAARGGVFSQNASRTACGSCPERDGCGGACKLSDSCGCASCSCAMRSYPESRGTCSGTSDRQKDGSKIEGALTEMRDRGNEPIVFDIRKEAFMTPDFRTALWTGGNLQLTVMTIPKGEEIGVEMHESLDQLIGVISGAGEVSFGNRENYLAPPIPLDAHSVVLVPAGTYHNVKNVGNTPLKLYSVYAPRAHKFGTVEKSKE